MYLSFSLGHAQILLAAGAFEEAIILALAAAILGVAALITLFIQPAEKDNILHFPLLQLAGKSAAKGANQHEHTKEEKQRA